MAAHTLSPRSSAKGRPATATAEIVVRLMMDRARAERAVARKTELRVFRAGDEALEEDFELLYWDRIPMELRTAFVWQLSDELYGDRSERSAAPERRLSRSLTSIVRG